MTRKLINAQRAFDLAVQRGTEAERTAFKTSPPSITAIAQRFGDGSWIAACEHLRKQGAPRA